PGRGAGRQRVRAPGRDLHRQRQQRRHRLPEPGDRLLRRRDTVAMTLRYAGALKSGLVFVALTTTLLLTALLINLSFGLPFNLSLWPPGQDYVLNASFKDANGVTRGADVVIAGHPVGQVTGVNVNGDRSIVSMRINQQYAPI